MNRLLIIAILLSCNVSAWSQVDTCGCDCNIVEIFTDNTLWYPKLDADQDSFYQDGSGAGFDTDDRDPCAPLTNVGSCDQDGDGYINSVDNCNFFYNTDQANNDSDSFGDACDNCDFVDNEDQLNSDSDNLGDACDNCPDDTNEDQTNSDADTLGDACDNCPNLDNEGQEDGDGDNVGDICDNCISVINTSQINSDADTLGDACDWCDLVTDNANLNSDGDSYGDACDNCVLISNNDQLNTDGLDDGGDICDYCPRTANGSDVSIGYQSSSIYVTVNDIGSEILCYNRYEFQGYSNQTVTLGEALDPNESFNLARHTNAGYTINANIVMSLRTAANIAEPNTTGNNKNEYLIEIRPTVTTFRYKGSYLGFINTFTLSDLQSVYMSIRLERIGNTIRVISHRSDTGVTTVLYTFSQQVSEPLYGSAATKEGGNGFKLSMCRN
jgi:hypothetical protein